MRLNSSVIIIIIINKVNISKFVLCVFNYDGFDYVFNVFIFICSYFYDLEDFVFFDEVFCVDIIVEQFFDSGVEDVVSIVFNVVDMDDVIDYFLCVFQVVQFFYGLVDSDYCIVDGVGYFYDSFIGWIYFVEVDFFCCCINMVNDVVEGSGQCVNVFMVKWCDEIFVEFYEDFVCQVIVLVFEIFYFFDNYCLFIVVWFMYIFNQFDGDSFDVVICVFKQ